MKLKHLLFLNIAIAILVASIISFFSGKESLRRLELSSLDMLFRLRGPLPYDPKIIIIEVDDENISKVGRWPWKRVWHAALVRALKDFGARIVYFDILFSEESSEQEDELFAQAIEEAGNVYLPFVFRSDSKSFKDAFKPIPKLLDSSGATGVINVYPDLDGALRKIPLFFMDEGHFYYHISLKIAMDYYDFKIDKVSRDYLFLADSGEEKRKIPLIEQDKMLINWVGKWKDTFKHYSYLDVLNAYQDFKNKKITELDLVGFKDSICIIAVTAIGLYDIKPTPLEFAYPGIGLTATAVSNILDSQFITIAPLKLKWFLIYLLALIPSLLISGERSLREILSTILIGIIFFGCTFLFFKLGIWIDYSLPLLALFCSYLAVGGYNFVRISVERKNFMKLAVTDELTGLFNIRYFMMILANECMMAKAEPTKRFCILMTDIDHFKEFNDNYGHQIGDFILSKVADIIKISVRSSDVVARYGGEEMILLLRGTPLEGGLIVAEKIRKNVEDFSFKDKNFVYAVTLSVGVSSFHFDDDDAAIIKRADDSMYEAKKAGRNSIATIEDVETSYGRE